MKATRERRRGVIIWKAFFWTLLLRLLPEGSSDVEVMARGSRGQQRSGRGRRGGGARRGTLGDSSVAGRQSAEGVCDETISSGFVSSLPLEGRSSEWSWMSSGSYVDDGAAVEAEGGVCQY